MVGDLGNFDPQLRVVPPVCPASLSRASRRRADGSGCAVARPCWTGQGVDVPAHDWKSPAASYAVLQTNPAYAGRAAGKAPNVLAPQIADQPVEVAGQCLSLLDCRGGAAE
jgi:hypothetical protein